VHVTDGEQQQQQQQQQPGLASSSQHAVGCSTFWDRLVLPGTGNAPAPQLPGNGVCAVLFSSDASHQPPPSSPPCCCSDKCIAYQPDGAVQPGLACPHAGAVWCTSSHHAAHRQQRRGVWPRGCRASGRSAHLRWVGVGGGACLVTCCL
jgi:hypothetical protein